MLEHLIEANTERFGVEIVRGAKVDINASQFGKDGNVLRYTRNDESHALGARLVVDASGPAALLGRHFGLYESGGNDFQTSAVWAYFKDLQWLEEYPGWEKKALHPRDEYTQHVYFREGWMWYIPIWSWQHVPDEVLHKAAARLIEDPDAPLVDERTGQPIAPEQIFSIGLVLRHDRDEVMKKSPAEVFEHYAREVPLIAQVLEKGELLHGHYTGHNPYTLRRNIHYRNKQVVGDGWLLLGDAAFFVDPLVSPGLTGGVAASYYAFRETLKALDRNDTSRESLSGYDEFCRILYPALERQVQNIYRSYNHPEALDIVLRLLEIDARRHFSEHAENEYNLEDTNIWGILEPEYQKMQVESWNILRAAEQAVGSTAPPAAQKDHLRYEGMVEELTKVLETYLTENVELTPYVENNQGNATS